MADRLTGIQVHEDAGSGQSIARAPTGITAFVGRTLRGPLNRPVVLHGFAEFERVFGGLWQPSTLSYAVEQYFEAGGSTAVVVREPKRPVNVWCRSSSGATSLGSRTRTATS